jgi:hypothetical protein
VTFTGNGSEAYWIGNDIWSGDTKYINGFSTPNGNIDILRLDGEYVYAYNASANTISSSDATLIDITTTENGYSVV